MASVDETWIHHFEPETEWQSVVWHHMSCLCKRRFWTASSAEKWWQLSSGIWKEQSPLLRYTVTLRWSVSQMYRAWIWKENERCPSLPWENRPYSNLHIMEAIIKSALDCVAPPTIQPRSGPVRLLFGPVKNVIHRWKFWHNDDHIIRKNGSYRLQRQLLPPRNTGPYLQVG